MIISSWQGLLIKHKLIIFLHEIVIIYSPKILASLHDRLFTAVTVTEEMADEPRDLSVQSNIASAIRSAQPITATRSLTLI